MRWHEPTFSLEVPNVKDIAVTKKDLEVQAEYIEGFSSA